MFSGQKLREIRRAKGFTLKRLAESTGLRWVQIQGYETGKTNNPTAHSLEQLALVLGVSIDDLFDIASARQRPIGIVVDKIEELAKRQRLTLPKDIYPLFLFQEALGIEDEGVFTNILVALARGKVIELIPVFTCDIKEGMKVYPVPGLGKKKYLSFTIKRRG
jgi:transcriptional regulator with XRE-family HTH domain